MLSNMIGTIAITILIISAQKYLSTRKAWQLGVVVPLLSLAVIMVLCFSTQVSLSIHLVVPCVILLVLEVFIWIDGRHQYRKEELIRMKAKDLP